MNVPVEEEVIRNFDELLPHLRGNVFHVTPRVTLDQIIESRALRPSPTGSRSPFGNTENAYFRLKGCVSFFDYRAHDTAEWDKFAYSCIPTLPLKRDSQIAILFLAPNYHGSLLSWKGWKEEELWSQRVVPYIECGYLGELALEAIERYLVVTLALGADNV